MNSILEGNNSDDNMSENKNDMGSLLSSEDDLFEKNTMGSYNGIKNEYEDILLPEVSKDIYQEQKDRDRAKRKEAKSKKELEEEEREKMQ